MSLSKLSTYQLVAFEHDSKNLITNGTSATRTRSCVALKADAASLLASKVHANCQRAKATPANWVCHFATTQLAMKTSFLVVGALTESAPRNPSGGTGQRQGGIWKKDSRKALVKAHGAAPLGCCTDSADQTPRLFFLICVFPCFIRVAQPCGPSSSGLDHRKLLLHSARECLP